MERRRLLAYVLVAVMIATAFAAAPAAVRAAPSAPQAPHPGATVFVSPELAPGCSSFEVGLGCGHVYFLAYDPSDNLASVTVRDQNYTRDGIPATAQTWNVSFTASAYNNSLDWGASYFLPLSLADGGAWNLSIHGTYGGWYNTSFTVSTYTASLETSQGAYLAQHSGTGLYYVDKTVNGAAMTGLTSVVLTAVYYTNSGTWNALPGSPMNLGNASWGNFSFVVPTDASTYGWIDLTLWANLSAGAYPNSEVGYLSVPLGTVSDPSVTLETCLTSGCVGSTFTAGTPVYVVTQTWIVSPGPDVPAPGLTATFEFDAGVTPASPPGGWPASVTTNATGGAAILFIASATTFPPGQTDSVTVTVTDPLNSAQTYGPSVTDFTVVTQAAGTASLQLRLDSAQYYGGDTAKASWALGAFNSSLTQGWTIDAWWAYEVDSSTLVSHGLIGSTSLTGSFSVAVPTGYSGELQVSIQAHNATGPLFASAYAAVTAPAILLNPSEASYLPGDTVTVSVTTVGQVFSNASLYASVVDSNGNVYLNGAVTGGQITIALPAVDTPSSVSIDVAAQDSRLGIVGSASITLDEVSGLAVVAGISTPSNYADGSYQPGQTIQIHYSFQAYGNAALAKSYEISVYPYSSFYTAAGAKVVQTTGTSGDISYTLPTGVPAGAQLFEVYVTGTACLSACYGVSLFSVNVQPNPSPLQYDLGAGSGLTVGWLVLFLIIVIVTIALVLMIRRRDRPKMMKPISPATSGGSTGGSGSGSEAGAAPASAWKEESGGTANPPLPNPPK